MNPDAQVFQTLSSVGIPGAKVAFPEGGAPPLPWFVYRRRKRGELHADDKNYATVPHYSVELLMRENDPQLRETFEEAIASMGPYTAYETWVPTEQCLMVTYDFTYHPE